MWKFNKNLFKIAFSYICIFSVLSLSGTVCLNAPEKGISDNTDSNLTDIEKSDNRANFAANSDDATDAVISVKENRYILPIKNYGIKSISEKETASESHDNVALIARPFGIKIYTDGVMIINIDTVDTEEGNKSPGKIAGLKVGDRITLINGTKVYSNEDVAEIIEKSNGKNLSFSIVRNSKIKLISVKPLKSYSSGKFKTGIWVRDSSAGIGTLTFYSPKYGVVCGLGHGVYDSDTGELLSVNKGQLVDAEILGVEKGKCGTPGELKGCFKNEVIGNIAVNSECGIFGKANLNLTDEDIIKIAKPSEVKVGDAYLISTVDGLDAPEKFNCKIERISLTGNDTKNMVVKIDDKRLIEKTGGIVQGMSGSPIIQNGKLIGAVTHVLVDDPTRGYGIFAENMLETARRVEQLKEAG